MMRIGLISDSHVIPGMEELPPKIKDIFKGVDLILHAGDMQTTSVLDELEEVAPVLAARGDDDPPSSDVRVKDEHILNLEGFSLMLCHFFPFSKLDPFLYPPWYRSRELTDEVDTILDEILCQNNDAPDIIVFGDTHRALVHQHPKLLMINPGSATIPDHRPLPGSVAILSLSDGKAEAEIIQL